MAVNLKHRLTVSSQTVLKVCWKSLANLSSLLLSEPTGRMTSNVKCDC